MVLFEDAEFPASDASIVSHGSTPISQFNSRITWLRPQEICASPRLFPDNPHEGQVKQGILGDCWFLCACAALQKNQHLLTKVLPADQPIWTDSSYTGQFTCQFWQLGKWVEVTIDDRLPCIGGKLCFSRCQSEDIFWLPLFEKAYAKLHGCYEELWAGQVADALVDITGGLAERWTLGDNGKEAIRHGEGAVAKKITLRTLLKLKEKCWISCSIYGSSQGSDDLGEFHAFNITEVKDVPGIEGASVRLIRIRNPWGRRCWNGPWREGGEGWNKLDPACASELQADTEDGEFWVEEAEFLKEFSEITAAYPISKEGHLQSLLTGKVLNHTKQLFGSWVKGQSAGGCRNNSSFPRNPKFWLRVWEQSEVLIALLQKHKRVHCDTSTELPESTPVLQHSSGQLLPFESYHRKCHQAIGLHIWKVEKRRFNLQKTLTSLPVACTSCHTYEREVQLHCDLAPGYYLIIPSTFLKDEDGHFLLRAFSSGRISLSAMKTSPSNTIYLEEHPQGEWETTQLSGRWVSGLSSGGCRNFPSYYTNPRFIFSVCADTGNRNVKVTLHQQCLYQECHAIGFHIYQLPKSRTEDPQSMSLQQEPLISCVPHRYTQEVSQICTLSPGSYLIVPSTYQPNSEGDFMVTIATKIDRKPVQCQETLERVLQEVSCLAVMRRCDEDSTDCEK